MENVDWCIVAGVAFGVALGQFVMGFIGAAIRDWIKK
jgi:hypothetical protein